MTRPINEKFASFRSFESSYEFGIENIRNIVGWLFVLVIESLVRFSVFSLKMPYTMQFSTHQIGGQVELCLKRGYALSEVCLKRGSTVNQKEVLIL